MHVRLATYSYNGDAREIARTAHEGMLPIFQEQSGFRSYALAEMGDVVMSMSVWDSADDAQAANSLAADWIADNLSDKLQLQDVKTGELLMSTTLDVVP